MQEYSTFFVEIPCTNSILVFEKNELGPDIIHWLIAQKFVQWQSIDTSHVLKVMY